MLVSVVAWYLLLGFVPVLLSTVVEDFWERVLSGMEYQSARSYEEAVEFCHELSAQPVLILFWPLIVLTAFRLWLVRRDAIVIRKQCDLQDEMVHDMPGAVLALESDHPFDCRLCCVDPRACMKLAIFHDALDLEEGEGRAMVFTPNLEAKSLGSETRRVSRRGERFFIFERTPEELGEKFNRHVLTGIMNGDLHLTGLSALTPFGREPK